MSFLTGFEHDVFVSYAHGPQTFGTEERLGRWSLRLKNELAGELMINLRTKDPKRRVGIWMDERLAGNDPITETLRATIERSALLVVVMSPFFLQGQWCSDEVEWFTQANLARGGGQERIFVVRALDTDHADWPATLHDTAGHGLKGYAFHAPAGDIDEETRPFGWPVPQDRDTDYFDAVRRLASDIARQIRQVELAHGTAPRATARIETIQPDLASTTTVFLGHMHDTVEDRSELRDVLRAQGLAVLPDEEQDPVDESSLREALDEHLAAASALVLVVNEYGGVWPRGRPGGFIGLQIDRAKAANIPVFIWLQVGAAAAIRKPDHRVFVTALEAEYGADLRHDDLDAFAAHIVAGIRDRSSCPAAPLPDNNAVICLNRPSDEQTGMRFRNTIKDILRETGRDNFEFAFADPQNERIKLDNLGRRLKDADTVLVVCFDQKWEWARPLLRQLNLLSSTRTDGKVRLLVAGPRDMQDGMYFADSLGFQTIDGVDVHQDRLREMLFAAINGAPTGSAAKSGVHA